MGTHDPGRPHWRCTTCGQNWPCETARAELTTSYQGSPPALGIYLLAMQAEAESDFEVLGTLREQGDLGDRFVNWIYR